ncbi:metal-dependent hydrolase [Iningainema tapete]|uniref:metal-dependent hydrolase n=1 Tax=Iningainema tapete TaxID=2806730 RepID=UPI001EE2FAF1|nr:metal-dependent hydrolase [Iningainema tapete]
MMGFTHCAIALAGTTAVLGTTEPFVLACAAIASQIPDVDTTKSYVGKILYPLAKLLEERFPHRSVTHSLLFTGFTAVAALPLAYYFSWKHWLAIPLGHLISSVADTFTKSGVRLLYPSKSIYVCGKNPRLRLATGTPAEYTVLALALAIWLLSANLISSGGLTKQFSTHFLANNSTAIELLRQESQRAVRVRVIGTRQVDNSQIDEMFWAVDAQGETLIVRSAQGQIMRVGEGGGDIISRRVEVKEGRMRMKIRRQRIEEAEGEAWIKSLPTDSLVVGTLGLEDAADLELPIPTPGVMQTVVRNGNGVSLEYASPKELEPLREFFIISGEVVIKQIQL